MALTCAVKNCSNGGYWLKKWRKQLCSVHGCLHEKKFCDCAEPFRLFTFPRKKSRPDDREKWKQLVGRSNGTKLWSPPKDSRVCSRHFVEGEPTLQNPLPTLEMGYKGADQRVKRMINFQSTGSNVKKSRVMKIPDYVEELFVATPIIEDPPEEFLIRYPYRLPWYFYILVLFVGL